MKPDDLTDAEIDAAQRRLELIIGKDFLTQGETARESDPAPVPGSGTGGTGASTGAAGPKIVALTSDYIFDPVEDEFFYMIRTEDERKTFPYARRLTVPDVLAVLREHGERRGK